jgi:hypothetical protein
MPRDFLLRGGGEELRFLDCLDDVLDVAVAMPEFPLRRASFDVAVFPLYSFCLPSH